MTNIDDQILSIEKEIRETPYHKGTEHHIGMLRARIARLKEKIFESNIKKSGGGAGYAVKKQGDATITLVGAPSVGKSTLLNRLTNAHSKIAPYAFTTVTVIPGMMEFNDARIQILDVPGLIEGSEIGKGRGREVLSVVRGSDLLLIMCDINNIPSLENITNALEKSGIRINKNPPNILVEKKLKGGIHIVSNIKQDLSKQTIKEIAKEYRITNAEITLKEKLSIEDLIDVFSRNRVYIPALYLINKIDSSSGIDHKNNSIDLIKISAEKGIGIDKLKEEIWQMIGLLRVYLVRSDEKPSFNNPIVVKKYSTLKDVCVSIGEEFAQDKTRAKIWGTGAIFPGQEVSLQTKCQEAMQVRFI